MWQGFLSCTFLLVVKNYRNFCRNRAAYIGNTDASSFRAAVLIRMAKAKTVDARISLTEDSQQYSHWVRSHHNSSDWGKSIAHKSQC